MVQEKTSKLSGMVENGEPVRLSFHYNTKAIDKFINSLFVKVLSHHDMNFLHGVIESILREMIVNAVKANSKRVFFEKNGLDITDDAQYETGMTEFKSFLLNEQSSMQEVLKDNGYRVELVLKKDDNGFKIYVNNNAGLLPFEKERIDMRIRKAKSYNDFSDMYMDISDDTEGEGLGISLTILFLKNSGIGENSFKIVSNGEITQSTITVPLTTRPPETIELIQRRIKDDIDELPTFPEQIVEIREMCQDLEVSIEAISSKISLDPSLAASVLKLANSAGFVTVKKIEKIKDAVKVIGLKNLDAILVTVAARKILDERFSDFREIWAHCNKVAFYARELAIKFGLGSKSDKYYLSGMLHDLGKIVLLSLNSELVEHIETVIVQKQMRTCTVLEEVTMGISHSSIGKLIAEKWNFPEYIVESIEKHHSPVQVSEENTDIIYLTYLANIMCLMEDEKFHAFNVEDEVMRRYGLKNTNDLKNCHQELLLKYEIGGN